MSEFLFHYEPVPPTTWTYLSSLLLLGVFFKFSRFWSVRNVDLVLLILLAPGLLLVVNGEARHRLEAAHAPQAQTADESNAVPESVDGAATSEAMAAEPAAPFAPPGETAAADNAAQIPIAAVDSEATEAPLTDATIEPEPATTATGLSGRALMMIGYIWLFSVTGVLLLRSLLDPTMVRRPLLEPNLSTGGLAFIGCSLFVFLMANVVNGPATESDLSGARGAERLLVGVADSAVTQDLRQHGPGNAMLHLLPSLVTTPLYREEPPSLETPVRYVRTAKAMAILSHLAVVVGIVGIGYRHFGNMKTGIGAATLYLMLPYTAIMTGRVDHALPAALLVWAVLCYRRPLAAGSFIGLAIGVVYYPLFLLPLWVSFYWQRGLMRFLSGVLATLCVCALSLLMIAEDFGQFLAYLQEMFGVWLPRAQALTGIWGLGWDSTYRFPVIMAFLALSGAFAIWPAQKNLGTLLSCSGAVMLATQFWHGDEGGLYMAWFLPLTLLTVFRPNLEDRVALSVLGEGWLPRQKKSPKRVDRAA